MDDKKWSCQLEHWDILASLAPSSHWSTWLFWPLWDLKVQLRVQHCPNFQRKKLEQTFLKFLSLHLNPFLEFEYRNSGEIWMKTFNWNVIKISNKLTNTSRIFSKDQTYRFSRNFFVFVDIYFFADWETKIGNRTNFADVNSVLRQVLTIELNNFNSLYDSDKLIRFFEIYFFIYSSNC